MHDTVRVERVRAVKKNALWTAVAAVIFPFKFIKKLEDGSNACCTLHSIGPLPSEKVLLLYGRNYTIYSFVSTSFASTGSTASMYSALQRADRSDGSCSFSMRPARSV